MALAAAAAAQEAQSSVVEALLQAGQGTCGAEAREAPLPATAWPASYKPIRRVRFDTVEQLLEIMRPLAQDGQPLIIEGTQVMNTQLWSSLSHLSNLLKERPVMVKRSPDTKFRYFDSKKNLGNYQFSKPVEDLSLRFTDFVAEAEKLLREGRPERMYLQETLSGHPEMAEEFGSWNWPLLIRTSHGCGWGLPDSNELFVGMSGAETPLHFDERENLFFQVRGQKEIVLFPFTDYCRLYPFPTSHPCDRQSMVGSPAAPNLEAFPRFKEAVGHHAVLGAGDLLYMPYGWWHWLRNLDHLAISVAFWSTAPPSDLSKGVPEVFTEHMLTRVRRNLESMVAQRGGQENHNESMLGLREAILAGRQEDPLLLQVRTLLGAVRMPPEEQDRFLLETIDGRFGIDWNAHVPG